MSILNLTCHVTKIYFMIKALNVKEFTDKNNKEINLSGLI